LFFIYCSFEVKAQQGIKLNVLVDEISGFEIKKIKIREMIPDSQSLVSEANNIMRQCINLSHLSCKVEFSFVTKDSVLLILKPGPKYNWVKLGRGNGSLEALSYAGFKESDFEGKIFSPSVLSKRIDKIIRFYENSGWPFAQISLDSVSVDSSTLMANISCKQNEFIIFDSLEIAGNAEISKRFIINYCGIKPGEPYNENLLNNIDQRLNELSFIKLVRPSAVLFYGNKAKPYLYLDNRKSSFVDGIIGFAPTSSVNQRLIISGEFLMSLRNILGSAKEFDFKFRSFLGNSQDINLRFQWPYFMDLKIGLDYSFNLLRQDTTYIDLLNNISIQYKLIGSDYIKFGFSRQSVSLLSVDTSLVRVNKRLPSANDIRSDFYSIGIKKTHFDYFLNPKRGYSIESELAVGTKKILRNSKVDNVKFLKADNTNYSLYDSLKLQHTQFRFSLSAEKFFRISENFVYRLSFRGAILQTQNLFINELFRIGGLKTLKGFDEQSIFADKFGIINTEIRYNLQHNSNFILFWNGAWYSNVVRTPQLTDRPWGAGIGINLEMNSGVFSLYYAVGKQLSNPVELRAAKIHFGFINYF